MNASHFLNLNTESRLPRWGKQILLTSFLSFGLAVPFASANCLGKGLTQSQIIPALPSALNESKEAASANVDQPASLSIVGLWNLQFLSKGQVVDVAFDAWHSDGTEILNDYSDPIEGNVCLGTWVQSGPSTYKLKHPSWLFDGKGVLQGTVVIYETVTLSKDGNSFSGYYTDDVYDLQGNLIDQLTGKIKANRIKPN